MITGRSAGALVALAAGLAGGLALAVPGVATAQIVELGRTRTALAAPSCPAGASAARCYIILTRTTAVQSMSDAVLSPTEVRHPGWIVAFTVGLSRLSSSARKEAADLHALDRAYGGQPQLALTVLRPGRRNAYSVAAESALYRVTPFLGQVLQEPLSAPPAFTGLTALPVTPGEVIGLTVPTWAPVLSYGLRTTGFAYRQSRSTRCNAAARTQTAQKVGARTRYLCSYAGTRVQYSATEVVDQPYPKKYVHAGRRPAS